jgi:hypothetical protein
VAAVLGRRDRVGVSARLLALHALQERLGEHMSPPGLLAFSAGAHHSLPTLPPPLLPACCTHTRQVCLSWAAQQLPPLRSLSNAGILAAEINTRCKGWGRSSAACQGAADAVAASVNGNSGRRAGLLCSLMGEAVNPAGGGWC